MAFSGRNKRNAMGPGGGGIPPGNRGGDVTLNQLR